MLFAYRHFYPTGFPRYFPFPYITFRGQKISHELKPIFLRILDEKLFQVCSGGNTDGWIFLKKIYQNLAKF